MEKGKVSNGVLLKKRKVSKLNGWIHEDVVAEVKKISEDENRTVSYVMNQLLHEALVGRGIKVGEALKDMTKWEVPT